MRPNFILGLARTQGLYSDNKSGRKSPLIFGLVGMTTGSNFVPGFYKFKTKLTLICSDYVTKFDYA